MWKLTCLSPWSAAPGRSRAGRPGNPNKPGPPAPLLLLAPLPPPRPDSYWNRGSLLWPEVGPISESSLFVNDLWQGQAPPEGAAGNPGSSARGLLALRRPELSMFAQGTPVPVIKNTRAVYTLLV